MKNYIELFPYRKNQDMEYIYYQNKDKIDSVVICNRSIKIYTTHRLNHITEKFFDNRMRDTRVRKILEELNK